MVFYNKYLTNEYEEKANITHRISKKDYKSANFVRYLKFKDNVTLYSKLADGSYSTDYGYPYTLKYSDDKSNNSD
jgi:hypothetical protein